MAFNEDLFLEESIDTLSDEQLEMLELPLSRRTFVLILAALLIVSGVVVYRLVSLAWWQSDFYVVRAAANVGKEIHLPAARGIIFDRFGKPLVENAPTFSISVKAQDVLSVAHILGIPENEITEQLKNSNLEKSPSLVIARNIEPEKLVYLKSLNLDNVEIVDDYKRRYLDGSIFSHILGYTGPGKADEVIGKVGLEAVYDAYLQGKDGETIIYRDAKGSTVDKKLVRLPENGQNVVTTIDSEFQKYFYKALSSQLSRLGRNAGVGIALDPRNGEVLALIDFPTFDNNIFSASDRTDERTALLNSKLNPLFNRAVSGTYTPGSVVKPMVAIAALKEGVVTTTKQVFSAGFIEIPNPYFPDQPSHFLDWKAHGWVDVYSAIARSSNIYFYAVGGGLGDVKGLGIERLKEYWKQFGFGAKTGIDLTSENAGSLPDPESKEKRTGDIWRIGDTYNVTIGQGDLLVTPIQIVSQIASIANGGMFYQPHLMRGVVDSAGKVIAERQPKVVIDNSSLESYLKEARQGMEDAVSKTYGTAHLLDTLPIQAAGKTGSSQVANNTKTNAFFVGYMPAENPQIIVLVLIEDAREGSLNAVPVGKDVLEWYYYNRIASSTSMQ